MFLCASDLRPKLPQANTMVANKMSHGTICTNTFTGVESNKSAPMPPPMKLIRKSCLKLVWRTPETKFLPAMLEVSCDGESAMVEVMLAESGSSPASINAGKVIKEPPPAKTFCAPAYTPINAKKIRA